MFVNFRFSKCDTVLVILKSMSIGVPWMFSCNIIYNASKTIIDKKGVDYVVKYIDFNFGIINNTFY